MDQVALGKRIKTARERAGMTQEDLAAAVDYSVDHMSVVSAESKHQSWISWLPSPMYSRLERTSCFRIIWMWQRCFTPQSSPSD